MDRHEKWVSFFRLESLAIGFNSTSYQLQNDSAKPAQGVSKLLLLSMFTIAARYLEDDQVPNSGKMWESGCNYLADAQKLLSKFSKYSDMLTLTVTNLDGVFHFSRPSTIQALLLLGVREFGIGL